MRLNGHRPALRNRADAVALCKQAHALGGRSGDDIARCKMPIRLRRAVQMAARIHGGRGLRGEGDARRRFGHQQRLSKPVDGLLRVLSVDAVRVLAVLSGVECLVDRLECFVGSQRQRLLARCGIGQSLRGLLRGCELSARLVCVEQRAGGLRACGGREQQARAGPHHGPGIGAQLGAGAAPRAALAAGGAMRGHVAEVELAVGGGACQPRAQLAGMIVDDPLVVADTAKTL